MRHANRPLLLVLVATFATLTLAQPVPRVDTGPVFEAHLAFTSPDGRLAWLPAGEDRVHLLGETGVQYAFPAWSPDGTRIATIARSDAGASAVVVDVTTDPPTLETWWAVPRRNVIYLDWTRAGDAVLLLVSDAATGFTFRHVTSEGDTIIDRGSPLFWDEHVDGTFIVHSGGPMVPRLTIRDAEGGELADLAPPGAFRSPAASPTGDWWAFGARDAGSVPRLVVQRRQEAGSAASLAGPERRALEHAGLTAFAWHPTRDVLALTRPLVPAPHTFGPLGGLDATTGLYETWTDDTVIAFWWSPDGERIAVLASGATGGGQVAGMPPASSPSAGVLASLAPTTIARGDVATADGMHVTEQVPQFTQGDLTFQFGTLDPDDGSMTWLGSLRPGTVLSREYLPFFDQYERSHEVWSPTGGYVALNVIDDEGRDVIGILDTAAGTIRHVAPGTMPAWSPAQP